MSAQANYNDATTPLSPQGQAALRYADLGWHVFPCWWPELGRCACGNPNCGIIDGKVQGSPAKHPIAACAPNGLHDATTDPDTVTDWWTRYPQANVAIALGPSRLFVIDVDGPDGTTALGDLEDSYQPLPPTLTAATGRAEGDGAHIVFRQPDDTVIGNRKLGVKLETRGDGGYIIAAPSIHVSGRHYAWNDGTYDVAAPPAWLVALCTRPKTDHAPPAEWPAPAGRDDHARRRLEGAAGKVALAPEGERNNVLNWAAYTAGRLVGADRIDRQHAEQTLTVAAQRAGLEAREIAATIASGLAAGADDPDHDQPPATAAAAPAVTTLAGPAAAPTVDPATGLSSYAQIALTRIQTGAEFILDTDHHMVPVWGEGTQVAWARGEPLILTGPTGVGKTTVAHQLLERLLGLSDEPLLDLPVQQTARKILYLACDRPNQIRRAFARRFQEQHRDDLAQRLAVHNGYLPVMLDQHPTILVELVRALDVDLVVVDSLKDVATELEKGPAAQAINAALQQTCQAGADVIVLHHQRKSQGDNKRPKTIDDLYGNTLIPAGAGSVLLLWGTPGDPAPTLHHLKQPADELGPWPLVHDHLAGTTRIDTGDVVDLVALAGKYRAGVTAVDAAMRMFDVSKPSRSEKEKARRKLDRLVSMGLLKKIEGSNAEAAKYRSATVVSTIQEVPL